MVKLIIGTLFAAILGVPASAQNAAPTLQSAQTSSSDFRIDVSWRESGLVPSTPIHGAVRAEASATYACIENGELADRQTVEALVSAEDDFQVSERGRTTVKLTLKPPAPGMFSCAPGQEMQLACAVYTRIIYSDERYAISKDLPRSFFMSDATYSQHCASLLR